MNQLLTDDVLQAMADTWHQDISGSDLDRMRRVALAMLESTMSEIRCPTCNGCGTLPMWSGIQFDPGLCTTCNGRSTIMRRHARPARMIPPLAATRVAKTAAVGLALMALAASPASAATVHIHDLLRLPMAERGAHYRLVSVPQIWQGQMAVPNSVDLNAAHIVAIDRRGNGIRSVTLGLPELRPADVGRGGGNAVDPGETPHPVPIAATIWMFPVALLALVGMAWRRIVG